MRHTVQHRFFSPFLPAVLSVVMGLALAGCGADDWLGGSKSDPPLPGKRVSVLSRERALVPESPTRVVLTEPTPNDEWPQAGGYANHAMYHMVLNGVPQRVWSVSIGSGSAKRNRLLASPIEADGRIFTVDTEGDVRAFSAATGTQMWSTNTTPEAENDDELPGGGLAFEGSAVFVTTGFGEVLALNAQTGSIIWRKSVLAPVRSAPTVRDGRVFVQTADNRLHVLSAETGAVAWTHQGLPETTSFFGGSSPAVDGSVVVVAYSSGELFALRAENGAMLWQEQLSTIRRTDAAAALTDVLALPVIDRNRVYAVGNADSLVAIDLHSGTRIWDRPIGSLETPWPDGNALFLLTNDNDAVAVDSESGRVIWVTPLQVWEDEEDRKGRIQWVGPVLASDRLIVAGSNGELLALSPYTGEILGLDKAPDGVRIPPILANGTLYFLTVNGELVAYR